jgi:hypothetical protein
MLDAIDRILEGEIGLGYVIVFMFIWFFGIILYERWRK